MQDGLGPDLVRWREMLLKEIRDMVVEFAEEAEEEVAEEWSLHQKSNTLIAWVDAFKFAWERLTCFF